MVQSRYGTKFCKSRRTSKSNVFVRIGRAKLDDNKTIKQIKQKYRKAIRKIRHVGDSVKPWAERFYKSKAWQEVRQAYFIYQHGICERCGKPGEIVHHKIYLTPENINDPNITLSFDNLELLCQDCHNKEHSTKMPVAEGLAFDDEGNLIQSPPPSK